MHRIDQKGSMKTKTSLARGITLCLLELELLEVGALAADLIAVSPDPFPVGNEGFFRTNGMKLVRYVHVDLTRITGDAVWSEDQIGIGWVYYPPSSTDLTEAKLLTLGKESVRTHLATFGADAFQEYPGSSYRLNVDWFGDEETPLSYIPRFRYAPNFTPVKGNDGTWQAPASVVNSMEMEFGEYVFATFSSTTKVRVRWFEGGEFHDYSYPYGESVALQGVKPSSSQATDTVALPIYPIIQKPSGIITRVFTDGSIVRYFTSTGEQLPGEQEEREPIILIIQYRPADKWSKAGVFFDFSWDREWDPSGESVVLEMSNDFKSWIPQKYTDVEVTPAMFYRAHYNR